MNLDLNQDGKKIKSRSNQVPGPSCQILRFEIAQANAVPSDNPSVTIGFVDPQEDPDMAEHTKSNLYGKHRYSETTLWFTENAKSFTEVALSYILEATGIKEQFLKEYAESDKSTTWVATAFNRMLKGKQFVIVCGGRAVWKNKKSGEGYDRYVNNDGIYLYGLTDPKNPHGNQVRNSILPTDKLKEAQAWFEYNQESLVRDKGKPADQKPSSSIPSSESYDY
jgi:hypothetical protein